MSAAAVSSVTPPVLLILLSEDQAAAAFGISVRKFAELRDAAWMPKPIALGPRLLRWSRIELENAIAAAPRAEASTEPVSLTRARIERLKRGAGS